MAGPHLTAKTPEFWETVEDLYTAYEKAFDIDQDPTEGQVRWLVRSQGGTSRDITMRLMNRHHYSPWVDEVAVKRALNFDWDVIANLTSREWHTFIEALADMEDPYEEPESVPAWAKKVLGKGATTRGKTRNQPTQRRINWTSVTRNERDKVSSAVVALRKQRKAVADVQSSVELAA